MYTITIAQLDGSYHPYRTFTHYRDSVPDVERKLSSIRRAYNLKRTRITITHETNGVYYDHNPALGKADEVDAMNSSQRAKAVINLAREFGLTVEPYNERSVMISKNRRLDDAVFAFWGDGPTRFCRYDGETFVRRITTAEAVQRISGLMIDGFVGSDLI